MTSLPPWRRGLVWRHRIDGAVALSFGVPLVLIRAAAPEAIEALTERPVFSPYGLTPKRAALPRSDTPCRPPSAKRRP
jgi:hypothetical protein